MDTSTTAAAPVSDVLWTNTGGELSCTTHLGHYATVQLQSEPKATVLHTLLGAWHIFTSADADTYERMVGVPAECERCRSLR